MPVTTGGTLIPVMNGGVIDPATIGVECLLPGYGPFGFFDEEFFMLPVYVPSQRFVETNRHVVVEAIN